MAFRLIRLFTGDDDQSHFSVGEIEWKEPEALNALSQREQAQTILFEETAAGARLDWHNAPHRQYVITLSGRLEFETRTGARLIVEPGDILLAEDIAGAWSTINRGVVSTSP
jgi:quercetin dioxygenase-like cupin family protein